MSDSLYLTSLTAGYGKKRILENINFSFSTGELCALLGLNGSGKSTLLKSICGLIPIIEGDCRLGSQSITKMKIKERSRLISYIPQRSSTLEGVSVFDALLMGLNPYLGPLESPSTAQKEQAACIFRDSGLKIDLSTDFSTLSEGQKQLVLLSRMLVQNTPVMIMDEPDSALDYNNRHDMLSQLSAIVHQKQKIGILATHDPNFALTYCDRLLIIRKGKPCLDIKVKEASPQELTASLSELYGPVELFPYGDRYFMALQSRKI